MRKFHYILSPTDLRETIGVLKHLMISKEHLNFKGIAGRIRELQAKLNSLSFPRTRKHKNKV